MTEMKSDILTVAAENPLVDDAFNQEPVQQFTKAPAAINRKHTVFPTMNTSNGNITIYPPGINCLIDSKVYLAMDVTVSIPVAGAAGTIAGTNYRHAAQSVSPGVGRLTGPRFVPCNFPLNSCIETLSVSINNTQTQSSPHELVYLHQFVETDAHWRALNVSTTPCQPDRSSSLVKLGADETTVYQVVDNAGLNALVLLAAGSAGGSDVFVRPIRKLPNSPFTVNEYFAREQNSEHNRASFPYSYSRVGGNDVYVFKFVEPLIHPVFEDSLNQNKAIYNVKSFGIDIRWVTNLNRMFQTEDGIASTFNPAISFSNAKIYHKFITPREGATPLMLTLPYKSFVPITQSLTEGFGATAPSNTVEYSVTSNNISFSTFPSRLYIYIRPRLAALNSGHSHALFGVINRVSLSIGNDSSLLNDMTQFQLWQMSAENGLEMDWVQWSKGTGGPIIVRAGKDIPYTEGISATTPFQCTVHYSNKTFQDAFTDSGTLNTLAQGDWELVVCSELQGRLIITPDSSSVHLGLRSDEVQEASHIAAAEKSIMGKSGGGYGGGYGEGVDGGFVLPLMGLMAARNILGRGDEYSGYGRGRLGSGIHGGSFFKNLKKGTKAFYRNQIKPVGNAMIDTFLVNSGDQAMQSAARRNPEAYAAYMAQQGAPSILTQ